MRWVALAGLVLTVLSGCSDDSEQTTGTATTVAPDPVRTLSTFLAAQPDVVVHSDPVMVRGVPLAVVGRQRGDGGRVITVVSLADGTASAIADLVLPEPSFDLATDLPVVAGDVTGDDAAEFLVRVLAADANPGVVVSDDGGPWRLLPGSGDPKDVYFAREPTFTAGRLVTQVNDCVPSCADGTTTTVTWTYDRTTDQLVTH